MSVCPHGTTRLPPDGFSLNLIFEYFFSELCRGKFKFHYRTLIKGTLHEDKQTFLIISRSMLLRMRNVSGKSRTENQNTHFMLNNFILGKSCVYKMWENIVEPDRPQMTIWRMRMSRYVPKATNTHTHTICNTHCFSTATMIARTHLSVTSYVHCLSFYIMRQVLTYNYIYNYKVI